MSEITPGARQDAKMVQVERVFNHFKDDVQKRVLARINLYVLDNIAYAYEQVGKSSREAVKELKNNGAYYAIGSEAKRKLDASASEFFDMAKSRTAVNVIFASEDSDTLKQKELSEMRKKNDELTQTIDQLKKDIARLEASKQADSDEQDVTLSNNVRSIANARNSYSQSISKITTDGPAKKKARTARDSICVDESD